MNITKTISKSLITVMRYLDSAEAQGTFAFNLFISHAQSMRTIRFPVYADPQWFDQAVALMRM